MNRYRITAGQSCMRTFPNRAVADEYAGEVVAQADPNIGPVTLERETETGWETVKDYGVPKTVRFESNRLRTVTFLPQRCECWLPAGEYSVVGETELDNGRHGPDDRVPAYILADHRGDRWYVAKRVMDA